RADVPRAGNRCPVADERPERKSAEDRIARADACRTVNRAPAARPPVPAFLRVQPPERTARRSRCLMKVTIATERISQQPAERRLRSLLLDQFGFRREGQGIEVFDALNAFKLEAGGARFGLIELVACQFHHEQAQPLALPLAQAFARKRFEFAVIELDVA